MTKKTVFKIVLGKLPGCDKNCFTGFVADDNNTYKDGGMFKGFVEQFNKSNWFQAGYTVKELEDKSEMKSKLFKDEYKRSRKGGKEITADACFDVEVWPLSEAVSMLNLLQAADDEGRPEKQIIEVFDEIVKKLQRTNEDVRMNNPRTKYNLTEESTSKQELGDVNKNKTDTSALVKAKQGNHEPGKGPGADMDDGIDSDKNDEEGPKTSNDVAEPETVAALQERIELLTKEKNDSDGKWQLVVKNKDKIIFSLTNTVQGRKEEAAEKDKRIDELEDKLQKNLKENSDSSDEEGLGELKDDIAEIKGGVGKLRELKDDIAEIKGGVGKLREQMDTMSKFLEKNCKKGAFSDVKNKISDNSKKVEKLNNSVEIATQTMEKMTADGNEKYDSLVALIKDLDIAAGSSTSPFKHITPIFMNVDKTDKVAVIGDVILHHLMHNHPAFRYDMMSGAYVKTDFSCRKKDLVRMGSDLGPWMEKVPADSEVVILSFGLNDVLLHPDIELQRNQSSSSTKAQLTKQNKPVIESLAEKFVNVIKIIKQSFSKARILYVLPPPSKSESLVVDLLREELKKAWQKDAVTSDENSQLFLCDSAECIGNGNEPENPGFVPWPAAVKLARKIYEWISPESSNRFSDCCSSIHIEGTCNKDHFGPVEPAFGANGACRICNTKGHTARRCSAREFLKAQKIQCGHCGSLSQSLNHHPDICRERFTKCKLCDMFGHSTEVHQAPVPLRIAVSRLGKHGLPFNKLDPKFDNAGGASIAECVEIKEDDQPGRGPPAKKSKNDDGRY